MNPHEMRPWKLFAAFEGGAVYTAQGQGRFFVIIDESTLESVLDEEDLADLELIQTIEFESTQARSAYLDGRFGRIDDHSR